MNSAIQVAKQHGLVIEVPNGVMHHESTRTVGHALITADKAHEGQTRKYTGEPYIVHPVAVAKMIHEIYPVEVVVASALLHDVIEDTVLTFDDLLKEFGPRIANLVRELTDVSRSEDGNRATRKRIDREHLASATPLAKLIKVADLIDNSRSIFRHDPGGFGKVYAREKELLINEALGLTGNQLAGYSDSFLRAYGELMARAIDILTEFKDGVT